MRANTSWMPGSGLGLGVVVFGVTAVLYGMLAAPVPFYDKGEPREALVVRAILDGDGVVLPRREGRELASKPPFFHWLAALSMRAGVHPDELALRLPSVVLGAAGVAVTAVLAARWHGLAAGVVAAAVLGSSFEWMRSATQSRVDMTLTCLVLGAVLAWRASLVGPGRSLVRLGFLCATCAVLTKGPVGLVLPLLVVIVSSVVEGRHRRLGCLLDGPSLVGATLLCGGWYGLAWWSGGEDFATKHVVEENVRRFVGWGAVPHAHSSFYYLPVLAAAFLPWTPALVLALRDTVRRRAPADRFLLVWAVVVLAFYSAAAGKRSVYLLPLFPPLAVLTGAALAGPVGSGLRPVLRGAAVASLGVGIALGAGGDDLLMTARVGEALGGADGARLPAVAAMLRAARWSIVSVLVLLAAGLYGLSRAGGARRVAGLVTVALAWSVGLGVFGTHPVALRTTPRPSAERVRALLAPDDRLCGRGPIDFAFRYYVGRPVPPCRQGSAGRALATFVVRAEPDGPGGRRRYLARPVGEPRVP